MGDRAPKACPWTHCVWAQSWASPTTTTHSYFDPRGRLFGWVESLFSFSEVVPEILREREKVVLGSGKHNPGIPKEKKKLYKNTLHTHKKRNFLTSPRIKTAHNHCHSARARIQFGTTCCVFLKHSLWHMLEYGGCGEEGTHKYEWQMASSLQSLYPLREAVIQRNNSSTSKAKWS